MSEYTELKRLAINCRTECCADEDEQARNERDFLLGVDPEEILALIAENDDLSKALSAMRHRFADAAEQCCKAERERDQLKAENEALRKDAERYRWLKSRPVNAPTCGPDLAQWDDHQGDALRGLFADEAIDAAMGKGEQS